MLNAYAGGEWCLTVISLNLWCDVALCNECDSVTNNNDPVCWYLWNGTWIKCRVALFYIGLAGNSNDIVLFVTNVSHAQTLPITTLLLRSQIKDNMIRLWTNSVRIPDRNQTVRFCRHPQCYRILVLACRCLIRCPNLVHKIIVYRWMYQIR